MSNATGTMFAEILLVFMGFGLYLLPAIVAMVRGHHQTLAIGTLNLFLGWTAVAWVAAFVWALTSDVAKSRPRPLVAGVGRH